jgi:16S rRNA G966 N2-methylase RsmD
VLKANLSSLGLEDRATVWPLDLERDLKRLERPFAQAGLVLLDPPYGSDLALTVLDRLGSRVAAGTRVVVEHHLKNEPPEVFGGLVLERRRRYGETVVSFYRAAPAGPQAEETS